MKIQLSVSNLASKCLSLLVNLQKVYFTLNGLFNILQMIHGNVTLDELMSRLLSAFETFQSQLVVEIRDEEERIARDAVKREQDLAFEMSLVVSWISDHCVLNRAN